VEDSSFGLKPLTDKAALDRDRVDNAYFTCAVPAAPGPVVPSPSDGRRGSGQGAALQDSRDLQCRVIKNAPVVFYQLN
jgi:hypothetical protein